MLVNNMSRRRVSGGCMYNWTQGTHASRQRGFDHQPRRVCQRHYKTGGRSIASRRGSRQSVRSIPGSDDALSAVAWAECARWGRNRAGSLPFAVSTPQARQVAAQSARMDLSGRPQSWFETAPSEPAVRTHIRRDGRKAVYRFAPKPGTATGDRRATGTVMVRGARVTRTRPMVSPPASGRTSLSRDRGSIGNLTGRGFAHSDACIDAPAPCGWSE